jgi:EKC/KEOPS complex subunit CGI121/TPRKB
METYTFPHFPSYATPIHIALFNNVSNSSGIRKKLIEASTMEGSEGDLARDKVDFGFVDASLVCPSHLYDMRKTEGSRLCRNSI